MSIRAAVSRDRVFYVSLFALSAIAGFGKMLVYARILAPEEFGVFTLALLITTLGAYVAAAGVLEGLAIEIPILLGKGKETEIIRSASYSFVACSAIVIGGLLFLVCQVIAIYRPTLASLVWIGPFFVATVGLTAVLVDLQIRELSIQYAAVLFLKSALAPLLAIFLAPKWHAAGVLISEAVVLSICAVGSVLTWSRDLRFRRFPFVSIKSHMALGLPFTVSNLLQNLATNIDRWAVQLAFGVAALGTYAFAMNFASVGLVLLSMVQLYAAPRMLRAFGASGDVRLVLAQAKRLAIAAVLIFGLGAIPFFVLFPLFINAWFPQYSGANELVVWVYAGTAATTMGFFDILFRAIGDGRPLVTIQMTVVLSAAIVCFGLYCAEMPVVAYAIVFAGARIMASTLGWSQAVRRCKTMRLTTSPPRYDKIPDQERK